MSKKREKRIRQAWGRDMLDTFEQLVNDPGLEMVFISRHARIALDYRNDRQPMRDGLIVNPHLVGTCMVFVIGTAKGYRSHWTCFDEEAIDWLQQLDPASTWWMYPPGHDEAALLN